MSSAASSACCSRGSSRSPARRAAWQASEAKSASAASGCAQRPARAARRGVELNRRARAAATRDRVPRAAPGSRAPRPRRSPNASTSKPSAQQRSAAAATRATRVGRELDRLGDQQRLARDAALAPARAQSLVEHALVGGVLIDQHEPVVRSRRPGRWRAPDRAGAARRSEAPRRAGATRSAKSGAGGALARSARRGAPAKIQSLRRSRLRDGPALAVLAGEADALRRTRSSGAPRAPRAPTRATSRCTDAGSAKRTSHFAGCTFTSTASGGTSRKSSAVG